MTARRESLRRASVRHQASREGRRNRAARQTRYRESRRESQVEPTDPTPDDSLRSFRALHLGFPARLKQARERSDLSMRTLSTAAGISVQAWSNSEAGKVVPRVDTCERMAVALGVAPSWLAYGEGNAPN